MEKTILATQLRILERLLNDTDLCFDGAFYAVFSDYPTRSFCLQIIKTGLVADDLMIRILKEI